MSLNRLLENAKEKLFEVFTNAKFIDLPSEYLKFTLFFAISDSKDRAHIEIMKGQIFEDTWLKGRQALKSGHLLIGLSQFGYALK